MNRTGIWAAALLLIVGTLSSRIASAQDSIYWQVGGGDWFDANNWRPNVVPGSGDYAHITNHGGAQIGSESNAAVYSVLVDYGSSLTISAGSLAANAGPSLLSEMVGYTGAGGTITQSGGTNTSVFLYLADYSGSSGTYNLSGGILDVTNNGQSIESISEMIGWQGTAIFNQSGGTHIVLGLNVSGIALGYVAGSSGTYNLSGAGSLNASSGETVGWGGTGVFNQISGTNTLGYNLFLGYRSDSNGTYTLSGGALNVNGAAELLGDIGNGTFIQSGGTNTCSSDVVLGFGNGSHGTYTLSDGALSVNGDEDVGFSGNGTFAQTGGTHTISHTLTIAANSGSQGTYTLAAGVLDANSETVGGDGTGTFNQTGGNNTVGDWVNVNGTYSLIGSGTVSTPDLSVGSVGTGSFVQSGGTVIATGNITVGEQHGGSGTYTLSAGSASTPALCLGSWGPDGGLAASQGAFALSGSGTLLVGNETVGLYGTGTFNQTGGTHIVGGVNGQLIIAQYSGSSGTYNLSGGILDVTSIGPVSAEFIGVQGTAIFNQSGGTNTANSEEPHSGPNLGFLAGSSGTYNLSGTGSVIAATGEAVGWDGTGVFNQIAGTNTLGGSLVLGENSGSHGTYTLRGGALNVNGDNEYVGYSGNGTFAQTGGDHNVQQTLSIATESNSLGTYVLQGGSLYAGNIVIGGSATAQGGVGTFTISGGNAIVSGSLRTWSGSVMNLGLGTLVSADANHPSLDVLNDGTVDLGDANGDAVVYCFGIVTGGGSIEIGSGATLWVESLEQNSVRIDAGGTLILAFENPQLYAATARQNYDLAVPEPASLAMMILGGLAALRRRGSWSWRSAGWQ
jgi:hypothetical protein